MLRNARELEQFELRARDGMIGHVADFLFDDRQWTVRYFIVATGTWLDRRNVLVSPHAVSRVEWDQRVVPVDLTVEQVRNSPLIDPAQPVSLEHETALAHHYNWPVYWGVAGFPDIAPAASSRAGSAAGPAVGARHLRSVRGLRGQAVDASDGRAGHVEDFLLDDRSWEIRYLVVDTRNWWPGKMVVVAPHWIREPGPQPGAVQLELTRSAVKDSPAYDPMKPVTPDHGGRLRNRAEPADHARP